MIANQNTVDTLAASIAQALRNVQPGGDQTGNSTIIKANTSVTITVTGDFFYLLSAQRVPLIVKPDTGSAIPIAENSGHVFSLPFKQIQITNPGAADITITYYAGFGRYTDNNFYANPSRNATNCMGYGRIDLDGGQAQTFFYPPGAPPADYFVRKNIFFTYITGIAGQSIKIMDNSSNEMARISAITPYISLEVTGSIRLLNPAAGAGNNVGFSVGEIYYIK